MLKKQNIQKFQNHTEIITKLLINEICKGLLILKDNKLTHNFA